MSSNLLKWTQQMQSKIERGLLDRQAAKTRMDEIKYSGREHGGKQIVEEFEAKLDEATRRNHQQAARFDELHSFFTNILVSNLLKK